MAELLDYIPLEGSKVWRIERAGKCTKVSAPSATLAVRKLLLFAASDLQPILEEASVDGARHVKVQNGYSFFCYED